MLNNYLGTRILLFRIFSGIISQHIKFGRNISYDWCPIVDFADGDLLTTTDWQSTQYVAFSRLSMVYFGLIEDFHEIDTRKQKSFQQVFLCSPTMNVIRRLSMIVLGCFYHPVSVMETQPKKYPIIKGM